MTGIATSSPVSEFDLSGPGPVAPSATMLSADPRLCVSHLPRLMVELICSDGSILNCSVRAVSRQDLVVIVPADTSCGIGDIVSFSVFEGGQQRAADQSGVVHWMVTQNDARLVALFTVGHLDEFIDDRLIDDRRLEIRFPTQIPVRLRSGRRLIEACIVNYSLNGIGLVCSEPLQLNSSYLATGASEDTEIRLTLETQWQTRTTDGVLIGCALEAQHGVLLARRRPAEHDELQCRVVQEIARDLQLQPAVSESESSSRATDFVLTEPKTWNLTTGAFVRAATPLLSMFLIGQSIHAHGTLRNLTLLTGLIGIMASMVFTVLDRSRTR